MEKKWEVMPKLSIDLAGQKTKYSQLILQLLYNRGITDDKEIESFFNAGFMDALDPYVFSDIKAAVEKIIDHIKARHKIFVYGDYDADGVTAAAVLYETLSLLKANVDVYIPDRLAEGYGLNQSAVDIISEEGAKLIITVDCGIRDREAVAYAKKKDINVIITDHHMPPKDRSEYPDSLIIDPALEQEKYPFKFLSGSAVSFKLAQALIAKSTLTDEQKKTIADRLMDLVAIGIVADIVPLVGENRILLKEGIARLNLTKRKGLKELIKIAKLNENKTLDSWNIAYQLAPRINAAGRMGHANTAFELLICQEQSEAVKLARNLNQKNIDRQQLTDEIYKIIVKQAEEQKNDKLIVGVCEINKQAESDIWNEGVIGLVAGKICEQYYRPTLVITKTSKEYKGSGRSIPEFNIIQNIEKCSYLLEKYGGHPGACGFSLTKDNLNEFIKKIKKLADKELESEELSPKLFIDAELEFSEINKELVAEIEKFAPFGKDNEKPKFVSYSLNIADIITMGINSQHLKLKLKSGDFNIINAIGFGQSEKWNALRIGDKIDIVYHLEINEFNGYQDVQLKIIDIKQHSPSPLKKGGKNR